MLTTSNMNFWKELKKPILVLAPMADVTDSAFRRIIAKYGKPDVLWTEFVSADGLALAPLEGRKKLLKNLEYTEAERPIVAQFFTSSPAHMESAARLALELGFDGVDINMGCPDRSVEKQGAGASLMKDVGLACELVRAAKRGAKSENREIPVSVKTRTGYSKPDLEKWLPEILREKPALVVVHARTRKEMSRVPARWEFVRRAVEIRDQMGSETLIFGNGDIRDVSDALEKVSETGCDGAMLGRAIFGNPWLFTGKEQDFSSEKSSDIPSEHGQTFRQKNPAPSLKERLRVLVEHTYLFEKLLGDHKSFAVMKKHFKAYVAGFDGAVELRQKLMETDNASEVEEIVAEFLKKI